VLCWYAIVDFGPPLLLVKLVECFSFSLSQTGGYFQQQPTSLQQKVSRFSFSCGLRQENYYSLNNPLTCNPRNSINSWENESAAKIKRG
jgi:hypothetical protein